MALWVIPSKLSPSTAWESPRHIYGFYKYDLLLFFFSSLSAVFGDLKVYVNPAHAMINPLRC